MSQLQACPQCSRPYDVSTLEVKAALRCICGATFNVEHQRDTARRVCGQCGAPAGPDARACEHCGMALHSVICPVCLARSPEDARHCVGCGKELACQALRPLYDDSQCPRCKGGLGLRVVEGLGSLIECVDCAGVWVEPKEFDRLCHLAAERPSIQKTPRLEGIGEGGPAYVPCVECGELMVRRQFQWRGRRVPVVLDFCRDHGVWLDGDELARVAEFVRGWAHGSADLPQSLPMIEPQEYMRFEPKPSPRQCSGT